MIALEFLSIVCSVLLEALSAFTDSKEVKILIIIVAGVAIALTAIKLLPKPANKLVALISISLAVLIGIACYVIPVESKGDLQINLNVVVFETKDGENSKQCTINPTESLDIENVSLTCTDNGTTYDYSDFKNNILQYRQLEAGSYILSLKLKNYQIAEEPFILNKDKLEDGRWKPETINLRSENTKENIVVQIVVENDNDQSFSNSACKIHPHGSDQEVSVALNKDGSTKVPISCAENVRMDVEVQNDGEKQTKSFIINSSTSKKDKSSNPEKNARKNVNEKHTNKTESDSRVQDAVSTDKSQNVDGGTSAEDGDDDVLYEDNKIYLMFRKPESNKSEEADEQEVDDWRSECDTEEAERENEIQKNNPRKLLEEQAPAVLDREQFDICKYGEGRLSDDEKSQMFIIDLVEDSYWIEFEHDYLQENDTEAYYVVITDDSENIYLELTATADSAKEISDIVDLEEGRYYIKVNSYDEDTVFNLDYMWKLKSLNKVQTLEDTSDHKVDFYYGSTSNPNDKDGFSFSLESDGVMAFKFEHMQQSDEVTDWIVTLKNELGVVLSTLFVKGNETCAISNNVGLPSGSYTIEVASGESYYSTGIYAVSILAYACSYWEQEPNNILLNANRGTLDYNSTVTDNTITDVSAIDDTFTDDTNLDDTDIDNTSIDDIVGSDGAKTDWDYADELVHGVGMHANLSDNNDVDNFKFVCQESGSYELIYKHDFIDLDSVGFLISVYDSSGNLIEDYQFCSKWNDDETINSIELIEGETYYIKIVSDGDWKDTDYLLRIVGSFESSSDYEKSILL